MHKFIDELTWRGMIHTILPNTNEQLEKEMTTAYVGIDPTADSLHIGHLVSIMMLKHLQLSGHKPIVLIGGATGMIGDPSGKSKERNLLDETALRHNQESIKLQLSKFLDFECVNNAAEIVNNYDWMKDFSFLNFIRDIGKHITVNYMLNKESVKSRLNADSRDGMSFTEFTYQLVQGYDFLHLFRTKNCKLQMGGSDQYGNITTGTELIHKITNDKAFAITCPLITKADGGKFGKTEKGNIWLSSEYTTPFQFYQFWLNVSDDDAIKYIKIFTLLDKETINELILEHNTDQSQRILQKKLAKEITIMVHSVESYELALNASQLLFGKGNFETISNLNESDFLSIFSGVETFEVKKTDVLGFKMSVMLTETTNAFSSKNELKRLMLGNGLSINKNKIVEDYIITESDILNDKYILIQKGKKLNIIVKIC